MLVADLTSQDSVKSLENWRQDFIYHTVSPNRPSCILRYLSSTFFLSQNCSPDFDKLGVIVVGTKQDLKKAELTQEEIVIMDWCKKHGFKYISTR